MFNTTMEVYSEPFQTSVAVNYFHKKLQLNASVLSNAFKIAN